MNNTRKIGGVLLPHYSGKEARHFNLLVSGDFQGRRSEALREVISRG